MPDSEDRVASCPISAELVERLVALAELELTDHDAVERRPRGLAWRTFGEAVQGPEYDGVPDMPPSDFVSPDGHFVSCDGDATLSMPFGYLYRIGSELLDDDCWADFPGWTSQEGARRPEFDAHLDTVVRRFTDRPGLPDYGTRQPKYHARSVTWRLERNVLSIGQGTDPPSHHQFEDAHVCIGSRSATDDVPFPDGPAARALLTS